MARGKGILSSCCHGYAESCRDSVRIQLPLIALSKYVTQDMISDLKGLSCYSRSSDKLTIEANEHGRHKDNEEDGFRKVNALVKDIAQKIVSRESDSSMSGGSPKVQ